MQAERPPAVNERHRGNNKGPCFTPPCHSCCHDVHHPSSSHRVAPGSAIRASHRASSSPASASAPYARRRYRRCQTGDSAPRSRCHSGARHQLHDKKPSAQRQLGALIDRPADYLRRMVAEAEAASVNAANEHAADTVIATRIGGPLGPAPQEQGIVALCCTGIDWHELRLTRTSQKLERILGFRHLLIPNGKSIISQTLTQSLIFRGNQVHQ